MRHIVSVCSGLLFLSAVVLHAQRGAPPHLRAGAAMADITPQQSDLAVATDSIRDHRGDGDEADA